MQNKYLYMLDLDKRSIMYLPGVGPKKAEILQKEAGISSYEDMLFYFPYKYIDRSRFYKVAEVTGDMPYIQMKGRILFFDTVGEGRTRRLIGKFTDGTGTIDLVWFKGINYVLDKIKTGVDYIVFGKPTEFGHIYNIPHPDIDPLDQADKVANGLTPFYNTSEKMKKSFLNSRAIQNLQYTLLSGLNWTLPETLPPDVLNRIRMMSFPEAIRNVHFPESVDKLRKAQLRLKFDELFFIQLNILRTSNLRKLKLRGIVFPSVGDYFNTFYKEYLPFELTNAQKRVVREIRADMGSGRQMNRLLQGDVGSGKTLVALLSMLLAVDNHCQACMMAPTEILAQQHVKTLQGFLAPFGIRVCLLTGSMKAKEKSAVKAALEEGVCDVAVGTHALLTEDVRFHNLGLAVTDEQHRFGVEQRGALGEKGAQPHILVMSATPIPRTLALMIYGDLDVSVLDELPPGRQTVDTFAVTESYRARLNGFIRKQVEEGHQVFVVCPKVEDGEEGESKLKSASEHAEELQKLFPDLTVACVHGRMKPKEKEAVMAAFAAGETDILVSTTVVEVGVDVPNATLMVVENAERFGLSQLHQLRGRVGRGKAKSYCVLVSDTPTEESRERLRVLTRTNNGFEIAQADLELRGPGDFFGSRQHGLPEMHVKDLLGSMDMLHEAQSAAEALCRKNPALAGEELAPLRNRIAELFTANEGTWN